MVEDLIAAIDGLVDEDLADDTSIIELHRQLARLDAITTLAVGRWDAAGGWQTTTAKNAAAWLATRCRVPVPAARRRVRLARELRHLSQVEAAWVQGRIDADHVAQFVRARNERTAAAMARDEGLLVELAATLRFSHFHRKLTYWTIEHDPDGGDAEARRQHENRRLDASTTFQGVVVGTFDLDPIGGAIFLNELKRIERELFDADWREAKLRLGRDPLVTDLERTPKQRRADALVEMAIRSATPDKKGKRPAPLFSVFVDYGTIHELANRTVIGPGSLVPWLDTAWLRRVVFNGPSRVIDVGVDQRLFRGATRDSVMLAGQECDDDYCDTPAEDCEADHIHEHAKGGKTLQANGRPLCGYHNRLRNRRP